MSSESSSAVRGGSRQPSSLMQVAAFIANVGVGSKFTKLDLFRAVPGVAQADRRMRDLRAMGWEFDNYKVNRNLTADEYLLKAIGVRVDLGEAAPRTVRKNITGPKRRRILERDGHTCQVCGIAAGMAFPDVPERTAVLTIGHIIPVVRGGTNDDDNLRAECQRCGDESRDVTVNPPTKQEVLTHIQHLGSAREKRRLFGWMQAGRRVSDDTERAFNNWARLPYAHRLEVMAALAEQVMKDLPAES
ncbi:HNH endonuclease signature motif containing protein [Dactylosporangium sp. NPDC051485]|uniref:HNH endonuclease n=1 Tax=Dactylosporangium sp. NPDC051485 TaxID=3154846 RepID=UPI0034320E3F